MPTTPLSGVKAPRTSRGAARKTAADTVITPAPSAIVLQPAADAPGASRRPTA